MCKSLYRYNRELKRACLKTCKSETPPASEQEFQMLLGDNFDRYTVSQDILTEQPRTNPLIWIAGSIVLLLVGVALYTILRR